jgi:predicted transcriptional regulator
MEKRTQESQKRKTEQLILEALFRSDPWNPKQRKLTSGDLLHETNLAKATLFRTLNRMTDEKKLKRITVDLPGGSYQVYYCPAEPEASKIYPFKPTRKHYERLANEFDKLVGVSEKRYMEKIQEALGESLGSELVDSLCEKRPIFAEPILEEFQIQITKWIVYRRNSNISDLAGVFRTFRDVKEHPEKYPELKKLQQSSRRD